MLADRVKYHADNREELRMALKRYLNNGKPVIEDASGGGAAGGAAGGDGWNDTLEED